MQFAIKPPLAPMEARLVEEVPTGGGWQYEPKWDGFRAIAFRAGDRIELQSKSGQSLGRYFPEIVQALAELRPRQFVLDGEIVIPRGERLSFDDLLMRIHPAASRVRMLARETPGLYIIFDLLADDRGRPLLGETLAARRSRLEKFAARYFSASGRIRLSPATTDLRQARRWLQAAGTALDGIVAKRTDVGYCSGDRKGMQKIKPLKTVDCVVGGFRYASHGHTLGSLLLGLYDDQGLLDHVGFISGFKKDQRDALLKRVEPLIAGAGFTGKAPGGPSRWSTKRSAEWEPLRPKLVAEVEYDQFTNGRFRHGAKLVRWRPDKAARQCTFEQVAQQGSGSLRLLRREAGRSARAKDH